MSTQYHFDRATRKRRLLLLVVAVAVHFAVYYGAGVCNAGRVHYIPSLPLDAQIPCIPVFTIFYVLAYFQWIGTYLLLLRRAGDDDFGWIVWGSIFSECIAFVIFILVPTTIVRPELTDGGCMTALLQWLYTMDAPVTLFPSIHCLLSWLCWRGFCKLEHPRWMNGLSLLFTLAVFASTVLVKQHYAADILGGVAVAELGLMLSGRYLKHRKKTAAIL